MLSLALGTTLALASCAAASVPAQPENPSPSSPAATTSPAPVEMASAQARIALTYDGGIMILGANDGELHADIPIEGFNRLSQAGNDRHLLVSTTGGFQVLDVGTWSEGHGDHFHHFTDTPALLELKFPAEKPGHVINHAGKTVLFDDGSGLASTFNAQELNDKALPETTEHKATSAHHGFALELKNGTMVITDGDSTSRSTLKVLRKAAAGASSKAISSNDQCPGIHGEAMAKDEAMVVGCEDGVLVVKDEKIIKISAPDTYGRIGNQAGSHTSTVVLGDYKKDQDAELEHPKVFSLTDTATNELRLVDIDYSYSFRSLGRSATGDVLMLGTDGKLHVYDATTRKETSAIDVVAPWEEPVVWQEPRPALFVQENTAFVTDPAENKLHAIDLKSGKIIRSTELPKTPNEISGVSG